MGWAETTAKGTFKVVTSPVRAVGWGFSKLPGGVKNGMGIAAVVAGGVGLLAYDAMNGSRRGKEFNSETDEQVAQIPPMLTPQDLMMQPAPGELAGPADGRGEYDFRNMVNASRGRGLEQPEVKAVQPRMSVIDPDNVRDLGASATQAV
ncbi:MAG: hypothetical protein SFX19_08200 [Alphaproteobacteria bacterium]|nr:hypothetical protein [Alphaproteobacteria bacterium]